MKKKFLKSLEALLLYDEVLRLRKIGLSYGQIQETIKEEYGVWLSKSVIGGWISGGRHPLGKCNKIVENPELAYVIGGWLGDGRLACIKSSHEYYVKLAVKDYDFAKEWGRCLAQALDKSKSYEPRWDKYHQRWVVGGRSLLLYNLLRRAKDDPWILMPYLEKYPADACRGFFDAEGGAESQNYEIVAYNTDPKLIELFKKLLKKIGIECSIREMRYKDDIFISPNGKRYHRNKHIIFRIAVHGKDNILRFAEEVGFIIARKRIKLAQILQKYQTTKIRKNCLKKCAKALIAANLVRLGLVRTQTEAARLLSINQSAISNHLRNKKKASKLLKYPEIEQLSREYITSRSDDVITRVQKILQAIIEIYSR